MLKKIFLTTPEAFFRPPELAFITLLMIVILTFQVCFSIFVFSHICYDLMSDFLTKEERSVRMSHIISASTKPELRLRHSLWRIGFRYRINDKQLPGSPDIVLPKYRTVIFVHGCFWHGHKGCKNYTVPKTNTEFWVAKVARNQKRDQEVWRQLEAKGWFVIIVWECELKKKVLNETVERVAAEIVHNGELYRRIQSERRQARESYRQEQKARKEKEITLLKVIKQKA